MLAQIERLVERLEALGGLRDEERIGLADLGALCDELDLRPASTVRPLPWMLRIERVLLGHWEEVEDGTVRCIYCGTTEVSRKSRTPRWKRYVDDQGKVQQVAVYRYRCRNSACKSKTFTNLPGPTAPTATTTSGS